MSDSIGGSSDGFIGGSKEGFVAHVFNFDEDSKMEMMNIVQYTLVGVLPVILLNKTMQKYVPEADDEKGSAELLAEVAIQLIAMFLGMLITHRIITFVPTYSTVKYEKISIVQIVLAVLMITLSLQTKLGEKVSILFDRVSDAIMGKSREGMENEQKKEAEAAKTQQGMQNMRTAPGADGFSLPQQPGTTSINSLPAQGMQNMRETMESQQPQAGGMTDNFVGGGIEAFTGF
tara:strand:+ start:1345 stop:2040 length:696 start_codon:yes stop_codon:yes gene_type:complete